MGAAAGHGDGDGFPDVYLKKCDRSILYHVNGDGTFNDVTAEAGAAEFS
jgi:enediyne biosynthesis protein E4